MVKGIAKNSTKRKAQMRELAQLRNLIRGSRASQAPKKKGAKKKKVMNRGVSGSRLAQALMYPSLYPGTKWPDENSLPSVPYQSRDTFNISTNSSGIAVLQANASLHQIMYFTNAATITTTSTALSGWSSLNVSTYGDLSTTYTGYRCVGLEIRFICTQAPLYAQGSVLLSQLPQFRNTSFQQASSISTQIATDVEHVVMPLARAVDKTISLNCRPIDHTVRDFQPVDSMQGEGWSSVIFAFYGCTASTQIGSVEVIANWELLLKPGSAAIGVTPASPFNVDSIAAAVNYLHGSSFIRTSASAMAAVSSYSLGRAVMKGSRARAALG